MADDATTLDYTTGDYTVVESAAAGPPGVGVPSGGTTGQALVKATNADYDTHWATPSTVAALDDLTDVTITSPSNGQALTYNGSAWVNSTTSGSPTGAAGGDLAGTYPNPTLATVATPGTTGDATHVPGVTIDAKGRVTGITSNAIPSAAAAATPSLRALGTGSTDAAAGNDSRLSDSRTPSGSAGGDLTGTYPSPSIATGAVTSAKILDGTIVAGDIAATTLDTDGSLAANSDTRWPSQKAVVTYAAAKTVPVATKASSFTFALADVGSSCDYTGSSAGTATVPPNASVAFPVGTVLLGSQYGAGYVVITPGSGVTILSEGNKTMTAGQYAVYALRKVATDTWVLSGDLIGPASISGLVFWFRGDGTLWQDSARTTPATADGDPVGSWDDSSLAGSHALQATAGQRPLLKKAGNGINSLPVIRFDGAATNLVSAGSAATKPYTLIGVARTSSIAASQAIVGVTSAGSMSHVIDTSGKQNIVNAGTAVIGTETAASFAINTAALFEVTYSSAGVYTFYKNGATNGTGTNAFTPSAQSTVIGKNPGSGGQYWVGDIAEIIKYDSVLAASDLQAIENYLGNKYGITVT